jgi:hypothetical protein
MKKVGAIDSVESFFEKIFRYAQRPHDDDPTSGFSDRSGLTLARSSLLHFILSLIPAWLREDVNKAVHLAVRDVSQKAATP